MKSTIRTSCLFLSMTIFLLTVMACEARPATVDDPELSVETEVSPSTSDTTSTEPTTTDELADTDLMIPPDSIVQPVLEPLTVALADRMNVLYVGVENPMSIQTNGKQEELSVSISDGAAIRI